MKIISVILFSILIFSCCSTPKQSEKRESFLGFNKVIVDTILKDKISIRAIEIVNNGVWYAADKGRFGFYDFRINQKTEHKIIKDSLLIEFRSIAKTANHIFILNVGNPALLYRISLHEKETKLVYQEQNEKVFYDSMQFWNNKEGIAIGDPISDCFSIIITRDGGNSWQKLPSNKLPKILEGEAAFAASNTNIIIKGKKTWIVSGGKKSRVFYSPDKGNSWQVFETPIVQGLEMTGIFTADFYNESIGIVAGGNYEIPTQNFGNKAITFDGGKNWKLIAENQGFGYASCIQFIPNSNGKQLICVGTTGLFYSADMGQNWSKLLDNNDLYTIRFINSTTAIAAGRNIMLKLKFE